MTPRALRKLILSFDSVKISKMSTNTNHVPKEVNDVSDG